MFFVVTIESVVVDALKEFHEDECCTHGKREDTANLARLVALDATGVLVTAIVTGDPFAVADDPDTGCNRKENSLLTGLKLAVSSAIVSKLQLDAVNSLVDPSLLLLLTGLFHPGSDS